MAQAGFCQLQYSLLPLADAQRFLRTCTVAISHGNYTIQSALATKERGMHTYCALSPTVTESMKNCSLNVELHMAQSAALLPYIGRCHSNQTEVTLVHFYLYRASKLNKHK